MPQGKVRTESKGPVKQNVHSIRRADAAAVIRDADSLIAVFLLGTIGGADTERPARRPWWRALASTASFLFAKGLRRRKVPLPKSPIPHRRRASLAAAVVALLEKRARTPLHRCKEIVRQVVIRPPFFGEGCPRSLARGARRPRRISEHLVASLAL